MSDNEKNIALTVRNLHIFYRGLKKTSIRSSWMRLKDKVEIFEALKGVSFDLEEGKILGIIGKNGSGNPPCFEPSPVSSPRMKERSTSTEDGCHCFPSVLVLTEN